MFLYCQIFCQVFTANRSEVKETWLSACISHRRTVPTKKILGLYIIKYMEINRGDDGAGKFFEPGK